MFEWSNNTGAIDLKIDGSILGEKSSFKMLGLNFSSKLDWCSYIISLCLSLSLSLSRSFPLTVSFCRCLSLSLSISLLSLFLSLKLPRKGNSSLDLFYEVSFSLGCLNHRPGAPSCYLELLDKLQKWIYRTVGPSLATLATSLEPLADIILVDVQLNWLNWFLFLFLEGGLFVILIDCIIFLSPFLDVTRMPMSTISFHTLEFTTYRMFSFGL